MLLFAVAPALLAPLASWRKSGGIAGWDPVGVTIVPKSGMIIPDMGRTVQDRVPSAYRGGLADALFTPVQQRVLALVFGQPGRRFQSAELIRLADAGTGAVHRVITRLAEVGLVNTERVGNQKFYQANQASPVFEELAGLVRKTLGLLEPIKAALAPLSGQIVAAFIYGSISKGMDRAASDVDLMVISDDLDYGTLYGALTDTEATLARPINPNLMPLDEWVRKQGERDSFVSRIASQPRLFVIGSEDDLHGA